ncbi:MAG: ABC transporter ATP-binding protein [Rhodospirillales bacterium]|nr:MAG: ABC transporter ATP-binding protein [Rhodospirillales bacterium]
MTGPGLDIRLVACAKTFTDGTRALEPLDLDIAAGETVVFLGPSGCGKTTTLRIIAGLERPDPGGRVVFAGRDVTPLPVEKRDIGMVFQSYALFPNMDVAGNVGYGLKVRRIPAVDRRRRVAEMLEMMHITELAARSVDQLSGGQKQRVALARALAVRPRVLLLDEPLTALDAKLREELRIEIDRLLRNLGITAVYVTHDQAEAMALGDRIVVMERGRVAQVGTPREVYLSPANPFVARFIGTLNVVSGEAADGHLHLPGGRLALNGAGSIPASGRLSVAFRPEAVAVIPLINPGDQPHPDGGLIGTVTAAFFLGDHIRLVIDGAGESAIVALAPNHHRFTPGDRVHLAVDGGAMPFAEG